MSPKEKYQLIKEEVAKRYVVGNSCEEEKTQDDAAAETDVITDLETKISTSDCWTQYYT